MGDTRQAADGEHRDGADGEQHRRGEWSLPPHIVASQFRIFTPVGTAMNIVAIEKAKTEIGPMPDTNMWWAHTPM